MRTLLMAASSYGMADLPAGRHCRPRPCGWVGYGEWCAIVILAKSLIDEGGIPAKALDDALHIGVSAVHGIDYLLWDVEW
ncbi:MAG TPA: hypothetical protein VES89_10740 [Candidatus Competibacteraceae bacterium]|nr:hypothetical protein [Candidatus Competibacteraceae bacterium]